MGYSKQEISDLTQKLKEEADVLLNIKVKRSRSCAEAMVRIAESAEALAEHAALHDMHFTATTMLVLASKMNRRLTIYRT